MPDKEKAQEKESTQNVKFLENYQVDDAAKTAYEKDKVYELPEDSAKHFINRKVAVAVDVDPVEPPKPIRDETPKETAKDKDAKETDQAAEIRKLKRDELDALAAKHKIKIEGLNVPDSQEYLIAELSKSNG